jgi:hypothetical protein
VYRIPLVSLIWKTWHWDYILETEIHAKLYGLASPYNGIIDSRAKPGETASHGIRT